jgi:DNA-binding HxlR family transcriptional regulator
LWYFSLGDAVEPRPFDVFAKHCPSRAAFDAIFSRWGILVLGALARGPARFGALHRAVEGVSEKMLAETLRVLEEEGLVRRQEWAEKPPRVEYSLTDAGTKVSHGILGVFQDLYAALEAREGHDPAG